MFISIFLIYLTRSIHPFSTTFLLEEPWLPQLNELVSFHRICTDAVYAITHKAWADVMVCIYIDGKNTGADAMISSGAPAWAQSDGDILDILGTSELPSQYKTKQLRFSRFKTFMKIWATQIV